MIFSDGRKITQINVSLIAYVTNLIEVLNRIDEKKFKCTISKLQSDVC